VGVPEEVAKRFVAVERAAAYADELDVILCLVLLDAEALDMKPLLAAILTLHHNRVFVGHAETADAVFLGIVDAYQFGRHLPAQQGLSTLKLLSLAARLLLGRTSDCSVAVFCVHVHALALLLGLQPKRLLSDQSHVFVRVERVLFALSLAPQLLASLLSPFLLQLLSRLHQFQQLFGLPGLELHAENGD
jgi:hypothetical protein